MVCPVIEIVESMYLYAAAAIFPIVSVPVFPSTVNKYVLVRRDVEAAILNLMREPVGPSSDVEPLVESSKAGKSSI